MKNTFGSSLQISLFGESHGPYIGAVLDGLAPGIAVDEEFIKHQLDLRRPSGKISTSRVEADPYIIASGVYKGRTTGTPLTIIIPNSSQHSSDYEKAERLARPGHADYAANCKYHGFEDFRGGGHFSGRITAALVAAGAIALSALKEKGIVVGTHVLNCGGVEDRAFIPTEAEIESLGNKGFAVLDSEKEAEMRTVIEEAAREGDSVGGVLETAVMNMPAGVGEPWFDSLESMLSHGLFSIPAIKGVQFGAGFDMSCGRGSSFNDPLRSGEAGIYTETNNNGGINGGISNGMPIVFRCAVKPTPSIFKEQKTIDLNTGENRQLSLKGRHDPAIIHRARVVVDSMTAIVLCDALAGRYGTDYFGGKR